MATGGNEQTASPLAEFGSFRVRNSAVNSTIHLCQVRDGSNEAFADKVRAIRAAALVWYNDGTPPSGLPGVEVLRVVLRVDYYSWDSYVGGLQQAESRGHRSVAVVAWARSIQPLSDHAASRRAAAAADIWVVDYHTDYLSGWQRELSRDERYQRL